MAFTKLQDASGHAHFARRRLTGLNFGVGTERGKIEVSREAPESGNSSVGPGADGGLVEEAVVDHVSDEFPPPPIPLPETPTSPTRPTTANRHPTSPVEVEPHRTPFPSLDAVPPSFDGVRSLLPDDESQSNSMEGLGP